MMALPLIEIPSWLFRNAVNPSDRVRILQKEGIMRGLYLSECLESCRWGSEMTVMWDMDPKMLAGFVENWLRQNVGFCEDLFYFIEKHKLPLPDLPYTSTETVLGRCPRNEMHRRSTCDCAGRMRCAHIDKKAVAPNFSWPIASHDGFANLQKFEYLLDGENYDKIGIQEDMMVMNDPCYAIIRTEKPILPLETIINRLRLPPSASWYKDKCEFPFDGKKLARYVESWHQQSSAPVYENKELITSGQLSS